MTVKLSKCRIVSINEGKLVEENYVYIGREMIPSVSENPMKSNSKTKGRLPSLEKT